MPAILYNAKIITYPCNPASWIGMQWTQNSQGEHCKKGDVFEYVWNPSRLRIIDTCVTIKGMVVSDPSYADDGDLTFNLKPDPEYTHMLSIGSHILRKGTIHVEIVSHEQGTVTVPRKGDYIEVTGVWVVDTDHGSWSEVHPAWNITILKSG